MHRAWMIAVLGILSAPWAVWGQTPIGAVVGHPQVGGACGCGQAIPVPVGAAIQPTGTASDSCNMCGGGGSRLCSNHAEFYRQLYAEFYAKNQWYVIYRQQEAAARRARMHGLDPKTLPVMPGR